ncbi:MAG: hypothetical protein QM811_04680 [Pirellulales bacterium]
MTFEDMLNSKQELAPGLDTITLNSPAPITADADGKYPIPMPGLKTTTEF